MRNTIVNLIHDLAKTNRDVYFLTGDLGYSVIDNFQKEIPERCLNLGISEQNMMGAAAGLALEGKKVFVYSIVPFATMRCLEQIRTDVALQNLDVTIIGVGSGFAYGTLGPTHHAIEDIAMLRAIPRMKIVCPSGPVSAGVLGRQVLAMVGPTYIRLNRGGEPALYDSPPNMKFGKGFVLKPGGAVTIFSSGAITAVALGAAELLEKEKISTEVVDMATVKPLDGDLVIDRLKSRKLIVTLEEHNILGGFGSAVAEVVAEAASRQAAFKRFGINDFYPEAFGNQQFMRDQCGLSPQLIFESIKKLYEGL